MRNAHIFHADTYFEIIWLSDTIDRLLGHFTFALRLHCRKAPNRCSLCSVHIPHQMEDNGDSDSTAAAARAKEFMTVEHWLH